MRPVFFLRAALLFAAAVALCTGTAPPTSAGPVGPTVAAPTTVPVKQRFFVNWTAPAGHAANDWLALVRVGDPLGLYRDWTYTGANLSGTVGFYAPVDGGTYEVRYLTQNTTNQAAVSNSIAVTGANIVPFSSVTAPVAGATLEAGQPVSIEATAFDQDGTITRVEFYADTEKIGEVTAEPYKVTWYPYARNFTLRARAWDNYGHANYSVGVPVTVTPPTQFALVAAPEAVDPGEQITVRWFAPPRRPIYDWVAFYPTGSNRYQEFKYLKGESYGVYGVIAPTTPGTYEFRYFLNDTPTQVAVSNTITVRPAAAPTITAVPSTLRAGEAVTAKWTAPRGRPTDDWVALVRDGDPPSTYKAWSFTGGTPTGERAFKITTPGNYRLYYLLHNTLTIGATSQLITVNP